MNEILKTEKNWEENFYKNIVDHRKTLDAEFQIYRQNHYNNLLSTLEFIYPVCKKLIGVNFNKIANEYIINYKSNSGNLHLYGKSFHKHLFKLKYFSFSFIAQLEWAMHFAYYAENEQEIDFSNLLELVKIGHDIKIKFAKHTSFLSFPISISRTYNEGVDNYQPFNENTASKPESILVSRHNSSIIYCVIPNEIKDFFCCMSNGLSFFDSIEISKIDNPDIIQEAIHLLCFYNFVSEFNIN